MRLALQPAMTPVIRTSALLRHKKRIDDIIIEVQRALYVTNDRVKIEILLEELAGLTGRPRHEGKL